MKKIVSIVLAAVLATAVFTGCDGSNKIKDEVVPYPVTVNNVTIEKRPKAVASLSPVLTKTLLDLGYLSRIAGYSDGEVLPDPPPPEPVSSEPEKFRWFWEKKPEPVVPDPEIPKGEIGTALVPNFEKIGMYLPEIIFTTIPVTKAQMEKLDAVNIKLIVIPAAKTLDDMKNNCLSVMKAMEGQVAVNEKGTAVIDEMTSKLDYISSVITTKPSFLYLCSIDPLIATGDTYESSLLSVLGTNAAGEFTNYTLLPEQLAALDPDMILFSSEINKENIIESEMFKTKKAVVEDKLFPVDKSLLTNQGVSVVEDIRTLAKSLFPELDFTEPAPVSSETESSK